MAIGSGTRLGPYEILGPLGAGGMGEVYKANDTRLDRTVAIKVLPAEVAGRPELRERLSREAKSVSSLNHPHICALYDVGHEEGTDYLVMEYLEGETLAARLEKGSLPLGETLEVATQIAGALAAAHRQGLIHRDLKPGNIMLTATGAKLLDFGLAKSLEGSEAATSMTAAVTATSPLTAKGTIVGTFQYMAPEQLEGSPADARSDIFAFGAVLYEMTTGRRPFEGKTQASLVASILKESPRPMTELAPMSPPALHRLVATCLEKDPDARRQTMSDVLLDLRWITEGGSQAGVPVPVSRRRKRRDMILALVALGAATAAAVFAFLWWRAVSVPPRAIVSSITAPPGSTMYPDDGFALSPDGRMLVYVAGPEGSKRSLWLRRLDEDKSIPMPGTDGGFYPFWSPDSRQVGFFADGKLKRVDARGGPTQVLAPAPDGRGGTWGAAGFIVYSPKFNGVLERVPAAGGDSEPITELDDKRGEGSHRWPWLLPDGRHLLFLSQTAEGGSADDQSRIELLDLKTRERRALFFANSSIAYSETGHVLFWNQGALYARPFDAESLEIEGDLFPVTGHVLYTTNEMAGFTVDRKGALIYQSGVGVTGFSRISWMSRTGDDLGAITGEGIFYSPMLSHDGTRMAYVDSGDIWVHDLHRGTSTRLSFSERDDYSPAWSPDDQWVAYASSQGRKGTIFRKQASGVRSEEVVFKTKDEDIYISDWSPDGRSLMVGIDNPDTAWDLWSVPLDGGDPAVLVQTPFMDIDGRYSPDGGWMVYGSTESGRDEIYVVRLAEGGGRWQISTGGGTFPAWRADGKELYFVAPDGVIMAADITLGDKFQAGIPRKILQAPLRRGISYPYAPAADGQKFAVDLTKETTGSLPLTLVQNWTETVSGR